MSRIVGEVMETLLLKKPTLEIKNDALDYKDEHLQNGETELHGGALLGSLQYEEWLKLTLDNADEKTVHSDWVVSSTFFVIRESDNQIIGMVDIRHNLNDFLASYGGHIGYGVRPSERRKGYATAILKMALDYSKSIGLKRVMLACNKDNEASRKTIIKCGGIQEREFVHTDGKTIQIYWINI
ncbi:GNAT family N-acetyltransferase [Oscillibacter sp.]|jgi:predicted acetyltransferase|uniref:GNAT family N-acetyltransferase n=1 Tax=Oscillibacter sp. TaxID=1945593 RepID=UPI0028AF08CF|nr:GNAT family N-acetyltransferase [Oscillibacter sp.]